MLLDGALATELERLGCDLNDALWSARMLRDAPEKIHRVHRSYFEAGADCTITASYQATRQGFMRLGLSAERADELIRRSVQLACEARDAFVAEHGCEIAPLVAASVGPYGAFLADGSEYRGDYDIGRAALADFHRPRLRLLLEAEPDLLAVETLPSLEEALAIAGLLEEMPAASAWITFSARDAHCISDGTPIAECAAALEGRPGIAAIGINCTAPEYVEGLVTTLRAHTDLPIVAYPNAGGHYDAASRSWCCDMAGPQAFVADAERWLAAGASVIGGCCRTGPEHVRALAELRRRAG